DCPHQQRVAVRRRFGDEVRTDIAAGARPVVDDHLPTPSLGEPLRDGARQDVRRPACRERHHEPHRLRGTLGCALRECERCRNRGGDDCQQREHAPNVSIHCFLLDQMARHRDEACAGFPLPRSSSLALQSTFAPDTFTMRAYFTSSAAMKRANASGESGAASAPCAARCSRIDGSERIFVTPAFHFAMTSVGVPAGASRPNHVEMSNPGSPASAIVGRSGASFERAAVVTASARSFPAFTWLTALARLSNISCVSPASSACIAGAAPLYGTCTMSTPASTLNSSPARWPALPMLPEPNDNLPGCAFAYAINSLTECTGSEGLTTSTFGVIATSVIGAKSFCASYGIAG